jgi:hypothetical protein
MPGHQVDEEGSTICPRSAVYAERVLPWIHDEVTGVGKIRDDRRRRASIGGGRIKPLT